MFSYTPPTVDGSSTTSEGHSGSASSREAGARRREGFTPLPNAVLLDIRLSRDARLLYALLQYHARGDGRCFPRHATLAAELGGGETALRAYLRELIDAGLVGQRRRGQGHTNMYILLAGDYARPRPQPTIAAEFAVPEGAPGTAPEPRQTEGTEPARAEGQAVGTTEGEGPDGPESDGLEEDESAAYEERRERDPGIGNSRIRMLHRRSSEAIQAPAPERRVVGGTEPPHPPNPRRDPRYQALEGPRAELCRELGDQAPPQASLTRAYNLLARSGRDPDGFLELLDEARATTLARRDRSTKRLVGGEATGRPNMVPYCFAVLKRLVDAQPHPDRPATAAVAATLGLDHRRAGCGDLELVGEKVTPMSEAETLWRAVLEGMREVLTPGNFARCQAGHATGREGEVLQIALGTYMERHWFDTRIRRLLDESLARCGHAGMRFQFVVAATDVAG